jgi:hypothetical protein
MLQQDPVQHTTSDRRRSRNSSSSSVFSLSDAMSRNLPSGGTAILEELRATIRHKEGELVSMQVCGWLALCPVLGLYSCWMKHCSIRSCPMSSLGKLKIHSESIILNISSPDWSHCFYDLDQMIVGISQAFDFSTLAQGISSWRSMELQ